MVRTLRCVFLPKSLTFESSPGYMFLDLTSAESLNSRINASSCTTAWWSFLRLERESTRVRNFASRLASFVGSLVQSNLSIRLSFSFRYAIIGGQSWNLIFCWLVLRHELLLSFITSSRNGKPGRQFGWSSLPIGRIVTNNSKWFGRKDDCKFQRMGSEKIDNTLQNRHSRSL